MRELIDLVESYDGDLVLDQSGDLADTGANYSLAANQIIRTIVANQPGQIPLYPRLGSNISSFRGRRNTKETGYEIARVLKQIIHSNTYFFYNEIEVIPFPTGPNSISFKIRLTTLPDNNHCLLTYNSTDNMIMSMVPEDSEPITLKPQTIIIEPTINSRV